MSILDRSGNDESTSLMTRTSKMVVNVLTSEQHINPGRGQGVSTSDMSDNDHSISLVIHDEGSSHRYVRNNKSSTLDSEVVPVKIYAHL